MFYLDDTFEVQYIYCRASVTGKQVIRILKRHGWILDRINGSHHIFVKVGHRSVPVPVHGSEDIGALAIRILREAGIDSGGG